MLGLCPGLVGSCVPGLALRVLMLLASPLQMSIVPDAGWKCRQKTKTVADSRNPVFHEHFLL